MEVCKAHGVQFTRQAGQLEFIALISLMTSLTAVSIDALLPALYSIGTSLSVGNTLNTQWVISVFIAGMVLGELFFGPLSDAIGRKKSIIVGLVVYCLGTLIAMSSVTLEQMLLGRVIQGVGISGPKIASRALVRDLYRGDEMARIMSLVLMVFILVPMLAPLIGQVVLDFLAWRWIFVLYLLMAAVSGVWLCARQRETLPVKDRIPWCYASLRENARLIVGHRRVMIYTAVAGSVFGAQLLFLSVVPAVFTDVYGVTRQFPMYFAVLALGLGGAAFVNSKVVKRYGMQGMSSLGLLGMLMFASVLLVACVVSDGRPSLAVFMFCLFFTMASFGILFGNLNSLAMQYLGRVAGLGAAIVASVSSAIGVVFAMSLGRLYAETVNVVAVGYLLAAGAGLLLLALVQGTNDDAV